MIDTVSPDRFEIGEEWDEVDLVLLDYVELIRAFGLSRTQAAEIAIERIDELYLIASQTDYVH